MPSHDLHKGQVYLRARLHEAIRPWLLKILEFLSVESVVDPTLGWYTGSFRP